MCGITLEVHAGKVLSTRGDEQDPFSQGHVCPKATALADLHDDPDRLRQPMRRERSGADKKGLFGGDGGLFSRFKKK